MTTTLVDFVYFIFGLYSFILILTGTPLNLLCFYLFKRLIPNRTNATIIVFSYLALVELLIPFTWNLNYAARELILKRKKNLLIRHLEQHSLFVCKLLSYSAYFSLQCSAWFKTVATFTRCVSLHHEWSISKYLLKPTVTHCLCWLTIVFTALINFPILIINGERGISDDKYNNTQIQIKCYQSKFFAYWEIVHLLLYNFIPFLLMILCNISIIRRVHASQRRTHRSKMRLHSSVKQSSSKIAHLSRRASSTAGSRLTNTLIFVTTSFIISTSPSAIFYISLGKVIKHHRNLITMGLSNLATTCHVLSFVIYWFASSDFQDAVTNFFSWRTHLSQRQLTEDKPLEQNPPLQSSPITDSDEQRRFSLLQSP